MFSIIFATKYMHVFNVIELFLIVVTCSDDHLGEIVICLS